MGKSFIYCTITLLLFSCSETKKDDTTTVDSSSSTEQQDSTEIQVTALDFNNTLVNYQNLAIQRINTLFDVEIDEKNKILSEILFELKIYREDLKTLTKTTFDKGVPFVNAMIGLLDFYITELDESLQKVITESPEKWVTYQDEFIEKEKIYFQEIAKNQNEFAQYHKIELIDK